MAPKSRAKVAAKPSPAAKRQKVAVAPVVVVEISRAPAMSALAARKAAAAAVVKPSSSETETESSSEEDSGEDELGNSSNASSAEADDKDSAPRKPKRKPSQVLAAGRYFAGGDNENSKPNRNRPVALAGPSKPMGDMVKFDDDDGEEVETVMIDVEEPLTTEQPFAPTAKLGRGKRQRREKSAFMDPFCRSEFSANSTTATWINHVRDGADCKGLVLLLDPGQTIILHGSYKITALFGSVNILGAILSAASQDSFNPSTTHTIFAPSSHPLPVIESRQLPYLAPKSAAYPTELTLPNGEEVDISCCSSVVLIDDLESGIEGVEVVLRAGGMGCGNGMWKVPAPRSAGTGDWAGNGWRLIEEPTPSLTSMRSPGSWMSTLAGFGLEPAAVAGPSDLASASDTDRMVCIVQGPKRVGKSTFAKLLLNRLLSKYEHVAYLDTDLGQPEFTTPGLLSLTVVDQPVLGPSFTHASIPIASHFIGSTSPASDPSAYLAATTALLATYANDVEYPLLDEASTSRFSKTTVSDAPTPLQRIRDRVPLVINTQGWVKGLGADLLEKIKLVAQPTQLFRFEAREEEGRENWHGDHDALVEESEGMQVYRLDVAESSPLDSKWSAADLRTLSFISYFHSTFSPLPTRRPRSHIPLNSFPLAWDFSQSLVERTPWALQWGSAATGLNSVHFLEGEIAPDQVLYALNACVVAIVSKLETSDVPATTLEPGSFPYDINAAPPTPATSTCHTLALVRSIDPATKTLHLLLPVPPSRLSIGSVHHNISTGGVSIIRGALELPICLMLDFNAPTAVANDAASTVMPYLTVEEGAGGRKKVRRNLMRRGQN